MNKVKDALLGLAVGDALGVPVEFRDRKQLDAHPVTNMREYGTHQQARGTWSDDSSLAFCLAESLCLGYDLADQARRFIDWKSKSYWTPHGNVFDIGVTTSQAINTLVQILRNGDEDSLGLLKYQADEYTNGNGSLMRIIPLYFYLRARGKAENKRIEDQFDEIWQASALTHGHIRSAVACLVYLVMADEVVEGRDKMKAYANMRARIKSFFARQNLDGYEERKFYNVIEKDISTFERKEIGSGGYVMESLEASLWCFLTNDDYKSTVLAAVNLGEDTDTTGAIAGGLAGLYYGEAGIPEDWVNCLARLDDIKALCDRLHQKYPI